MSLMSKSLNPIQARSTKKKTPAAASSQMRNPSVLAPKQMEQETHSSLKNHPSQENIYEIPMATMKSDNKPEKKDKLKNHGYTTTTEGTYSLKEFNDNKTMIKDILDTRAEQDNEKEENIDEAGLSEDSQMTLLRFRSFILQISGLDSTNYRAIERILAIDTSSEGSIIQAAKEYCQDTN